VWFEGRDFDAAEVGVEKGRDCAQSWTKVAKEPFEKMSRNRRSLNTSNCKGLKEELIWGLEIRDRIAARDEISSPHKIHFHELIDEYTHI